MGLPQRQELGGYESYELKNKPVVDVKLLGINWIHMAVMSKWWN
jgi:hypothetical protein